MLFLVDSGGQEALAGNDKTKSMKGYLQEVCPTLLLFSLPERCQGHAATGQSRDIHFSARARPTALRTCSQSLPASPGCQMVTSRRCAFHKDVQTNLKNWSLLVQRQHDWGTFFRTLGCFGSYGEQMVCRLSGITAMIFPLRCHWSAFRRGAWLAGHRPSWATVFCFLTLLLKHAGWEIWIIYQQKSYTAHTGLLLTTANH